MSNVSFLRTMESHFYTHEQLINLAQFNSKDIEQVNQRRRQHNRLGFGCQIAFVRLANRFPYQNPFEIIKEIIQFVSIQLKIPSENITAYTQRRQTIDSLAPFPLFQDCCIHC